MTWISEPATDAAAVVSRYDAIEVVAIDSVDLLETAADRLADFAGAEGGSIDTGTIQLAVDLRRVRENLILGCRLQKPTLPREVLEKLRSDFNFIGMSDPDERRALVQKVAGRNVERLAELTMDEAEALRAEIQKLEEPF